MSEESKSKPAVASPASKPVATATKPAATATKPAATVAKSATTAAKKATKAIPAKSISELREVTLTVRRVNKVVKGGRILSFSVYVAVGDENGKVGFGKGKARDVPEAMKKATEAAKRNLKSVKLINGTIFHAVRGKHGASSVYLQPAAPGTGRIAGGHMRALLELVGIKNVLAKIIGSNNHNNVVRATMDALSRIRSPAEIALRRGKPLQEIEAKHKLLS